jgi:hypothetical protein
MRQFSFHICRSFLISDDPLAIVFIAALYIRMCLTAERINPVKLFLHVFPSVKPFHVAAVAISLMVYIFISDVKALVYSGLKTFFHSILSIFFRSVDVVGRYVFLDLASWITDLPDAFTQLVDCLPFQKRENIPQYGPVIFTST